MDRPIIILAMPRSGSSMTAGLFVQHGVWCGTCTPPTKYNKKGGFEHVRIRQLIKRGSGNLIAKAREAEYTDIRDEVARIIEQDGYAGGPWLFKCSALYWRLFQGLDPIWVTARRPVESVLKSARNTNITGLDRSSAVHIDVMDRLESDGALRIDTPKLIAGDYEQAESVFSTCGLVFDQDIANDWIEPDQWHY